MKLADIGGTTSDVADVSKSQRGCVIISERVVNFANIPLFFKKGS